MKNLVYLITLTILTACGSDNNSTGQSFVPNNNQGSDQVSEQPSELEQLTTASEGSRGTCLPLDFSRLDCSESLTSLDDESLSKASYSVPVSYVAERSTYELTSLELPHSAIEEMENSAMASEGDYADYLLYKTVTRKSDKFFYFLNSISGGNGINASGDVQNFSAEVKDSTVPVSYVVDCMENGTTFHMVTGRYGLKMSYRNYDSSSNRYELTLSGLSKQGDKVVKHTRYCTLSDIDQAENSVEDAAEEVEDAADDVEEGAEEVAEDVEEGAEEAVEDVEEGVEEAVEDVEEGAEEVAEDVEEGLEDTAEAVDSATQDVQSEAQEAKEAVGNAVKETGEAIEEGLDKAGDAIESGVAKAQQSAKEVGEKIGEEVDEAGDATTEAVADGVEAVDRTLEEGAAVVEGTAEAIAEKAEEMGEDIDNEIDEARAENDNETEEENGFVEWLRNLFR